MWVCFTEISSTDGFATRFETVSDAGKETMFGVSRIETRGTTTCFFSDPFDVVFITRFPGSRSSLIVACSAASESSARSLKDGLLFFCPL